MVLDYSLLIKQICSVIAPKWYIKKSFASNHSYNLNFKRPRTFSEKIAIRKFRYTREMSVLSDKIKVKDYVKERIGEEYLVPTYATLDRLTQKAFDELPQSFVIKANHGSRLNLIVKDKSQYTFKEVKKITDKWLRKKYYLIGMELHYRHIKPGLIVEELLLNEQGEVPKDYKIHYFKNKGDVKYFTEVHADRFSNFRCNFYDGGWNRINNPWVGEEEFDDENMSTRPDRYDELLDVTKRLAEPFKYVRVDFYVFNNRIYFGELTFTPTGGTLRFKKKTMDEYLGNLWED
ncbi:glycosyltransferase [Leptobacterium flavescens]|uniref:Glycosyltransferase n=1 Tax=Leptobacterium flavescens TaxID=472055 RepID=A0A6P0UKU3_9FLAO|nr:ATP-grasp fold amidoligase family protein [Leptobacterium flavescens]NER13991.1 glycosyltransferase [Leptobacterium flavescens]